MRGCLFVLIAAALVVGAGAWFGSPVLASSAIGAALEGGGYHAATSTISVTSNPPPRLLLGRADEVRIDGADVDFRTFHAAGLHLVLTDVDLVARRAARINGTIDGAELRTAGGEPTTADVEIDGPADAADATILVEAATVERVVRAAFQTSFGVSIATSELVAPDILRVTAPGATLEGRLTIDAAGAIALTTPLGSTTVISLDPSFPLRLRSLSAVDGDLRILAVLNAERLLGG